MNYKIYYLEHPTEGIFYVGITKLSLKKRKQNGYYTNDEVHQLSKNSTINLIVETDDKSLEDFYIQEFSKKHKLLNKIRGMMGKTQKEYINEYRELNRENYNEYMKNFMTEYRENNREEYNEYMRNYMREYNKNKKLKCQV